MRWKRRKAFVLIVGGTAVFSLTIVGLEAMYRAGVSGEDVLRALCGIELLLIALVFVWFFGQM